ncbi:unnamed protein product [Blepharisma stoltei]|uniref:Uncharacterized protein n=1 Tax=Blepharisma stoltei TaxID=1481888 RepID=A0AAU9IRI5_9CILI|nr:unnamed protein product [Blepharisma stoltei]
MPQKLQKRDREDANPNALSSKGCRSLKEQLNLIKDSNKSFEEYIMSFDLRYFYELDKRSQSPRIFNNIEEYRNWLLDSFLHEFSKSICKDAMKIKILSKL